MKLALWNIAGGFPLITRGQEWSRDNYKEEDIEAFIPPLQKTGADIFCLQEVHAESPTDSQQITALCESLQAKPTKLYTYSNNSHIKPGSHLAMAILSKLPITKTIMQKLPNPHLTITRPDGSIWKSLDCGFIISEIEYAGQKIHIVDGHLVPFHYYGRDFSDSAFDFIRDAIAEILLPLSDKPTVIAADFNFDGLERLLPKLFPTFTEVFHEQTTPTKGQQDHILVSSHWNVLDFKVKKEVSDHFLCTAEIELK